MKIKSDVRYSRQILLPVIGPEGQKKLSGARVLLVGCGATGGAIAMHLVRAGVGKLVLLDRDVLEASNLHRQVLFDEKDIGAPKAILARQRLRAINPSVNVEGLAEDFTAATASLLVSGSDMVLDGTDNLETRYIINDACVKLKKPWIYVGAVSTHGMMAVIRPGKGPCLRCILPGLPGPGSVPTCASVGVLNTAPAIMGALAATEAIKYIVGANPETKMVIYDCWTGDHHRVRVQQKPDCPCCVKNRFEYLDTPISTKASVLCGSNTVQITPPRPGTMDLEKLARSLRALGEGAVKPGPGYLVFVLKRYRMTVFGNGRVLVSGTGDEKVARGLYSEYIGN